MTLFIRFLGKAELSRDDKPLQLKGQKPLALLAYLVVTGKVHTREHLVDLLYDEADDPRASLRWTLNQLRQTIGADYLVTDRDHIGFNFESDYWLDLNVLSAGETKSYRGEFLEGVYLRDAQRFMDWAFYERERLREAYQNALASQFEESERRGEYQTVIDIAHQLLRLDNLHEEWYRALMRAYTLSGHREAALAQYDLCRQTLAADLGVEPDEETTLLYEQIQAGTLTDPRSLADLPVHFPPFLQRESPAGIVEPPPFVARLRELERLDQFLGQALAGQGQVAFVVGGAGRGKTALLAEFVRQAQTVHPDLLVAAGNCNAYSGLGDPYLPFRDVMGMLTGDIEARLAAGTITLDHARRLWAAVLPTCQTLLEHGQNLIGVLVPPRELLARTKAAAARDAGELDQLRRLAERAETATSDLAQEYLFQQLTNVLHALAERKPLLILLDDLQWADATSISLLFHLGRRLDGSRILLVGAYRPEEVALGRPSTLPPTGVAGQAERHPLEKVLTEFKRLFGDVWVDLGRIDEIESQQFVELFLDSEPNQLGIAFRRALYRHTGGHPLFTVELLRAMQERGDLVRNEPGQWVAGASLNWERLPARVEAVIEERIGRLEEELRQILTVASVDGEEFTAQVVAQVQAIGERQLLGQLSQVLARKHRLVHDRGEVQIGNQTLSRYQFAHILFQRYLYNGLSAGERRLLHGEIGTVLETLFGAQTNEIAVQLAWHFQEANLPEKACHYLRQAGEQAARQYAIDEAIAYFSRALNLAPVDNLTERYNLLLAREKGYDLQGKREFQSQDLAALQQLAETLADDRQRAEVALGQANYAEATGDYPVAIAAAQAAIELAQVAHDVKSVAVGYQLWGRALWRQGDYGAAQSQLEHALALAQTARLYQVEADSLRNLGAVSGYLGNYTEASTYDERALYFCRELGNRLGESQSLNDLGLDFTQQAAYIMAKVYLEQALYIKQEIGDRRGEGNALNNLGLVFFHLGDYAKTKEYYEHALHTYREISDRWGEAAVTTNLALLFHHLGDEEAAREYSQQALFITRELGDRDGQGYALTNLGHTLMGLEHLVEAADAYQQALVLRRELGQHNLVIEVLAGLARVFMAQGNLTEALVQVEEILSYLENNTLDGTEEPFRIYLTCYRVLQPNQDSRAQVILKTAHNLLQERAAKISDETLRRSFLENVAAHREIVAAFEKVQRESEVGENH